MPETLKISLIVVLCFGISNANSVVETLVIVRHDVSQSLYAPCEDLTQCFLRIEERSIEISGHPDSIQVISGKLNQLY